jgi:hypothetical protein
VWQELDKEIEDRALVCHSVGWLILDGQRAKVVAAHINDENGHLQGGGVMTIPTRAVLRIMELTMDRVMAEDQGAWRLAKGCAPPTAQPEALRAALSGGPREKGDT